MASEEDHSNLSEKYHSNCIFIVKVMKFFTREKLLMLIIFFQGKTFFEILRNNFYGFLE